MRTRCGTAPRRSSSIRRARPKWRAGSVRSPREASHISSPSLTGESCGYAYAGPYRARPAYRFSVEDSVYVAAEAHRRGVGRALLDRLIVESEARGFRQMIAVIGDSAQAPSIELHRAAGFRLIGAIEVGGIQIRPLARFRPDATCARAGRVDDAVERSAAPRTRGVYASPAIRLSDRSSTRSTRSSSWPRLRISPVTDTTL